MILLAAVSVSAACVMLNTGACYTSLVNPDTTFNDTPQDLAPAARLAAASSGSFAPTFRKFLGPGDAPLGEEAVEQVKYGKVCGVSAKVDGVSYTCTSPEKTQESGEFIYAFFGDRDSRTASWAVRVNLNTERTDPNLNGFCSVLDLSGTGLCWFASMDVSGDYVGFADAKTCEDTDTDGDGLGPDCPDESRSCMEGEGTCKGVKWDDPGCAQSTFRFSDTPQSWPRCMNFCIDDDEDFACSPLSTRSGRIDVPNLYGGGSSSQYPWWYWNQAEDYYKTLRLVYAEAENAAKYIANADPACPELAIDTSCCVEACSAEEWAFLPPCEYCDRKVVLDYTHFDRFLRNGASFASAPTFWTAVYEWLDADQMLKFPDDSPMFDCNDENPEVTPFVEEDSCNFVDDDCDGIVDECSDVVISSGDLSGGSSGTGVDGAAVIGPVPELKSVKKMSKNKITGLVVDDFSYVPYSCDDMDSEHLDENLNWAAQVAGSSTLPFGSDYNLNFFSELWSPNYARTDSPPREGYICISAVSNTGYTEGQFRADVIVNGETRTILFPKFQIARAAHERPGHTPGWEMDASIQSGVKITGRIKPESEIKYYFRANDDEDWVLGRYHDIVRSTCEAHSAGDDCDPEGGEDNIGTCEGSTPFMSCVVPTELTVYAHPVDLHSSASWKGEFGSMSSKPRSCIYRSPFVGCQVLDSDGDTFKNASFGCPDCTDCNDANQDIYPGATDDVVNGIDENCNGVGGEMLNSDADAVPDRFDWCIGEDTLVGPITPFGCWYSVGLGHDSLPHWSVG
jgi:hypothetical protein